MSEGYSGIKLLSISCDLKALTLSILALDTHNVAMFCLSVEHNCHNGVGLTHLGTCLVVLTAIVPHSQELTLRQEVLCLWTNAFDAFRNSLDVELRWQVVWGS